MKYISTRGEAPSLGFDDVLLAGLARDGGLYVPEIWPQMTPHEISSLAGRSYAEVALEITRRFTGDAFALEELEAIIERAYGAFGHPAVAPLVQVDHRTWLLELFHGPTLAFKDVAMQLLAPMMDAVLARDGKRVTIVGATSGDTGSAAIEAFRGRDAIDVFILHPHGRVSEIQRRQMTTVLDDNVHNIALDGTFDDCQALLKALFNDHAFRDRIGLAGVNSINWARVLAQVVYYFTSAVALGAPDRTVSFVVPTGNFGDIFAGYVAGRMGLPLERLVVATNINDILHRALTTGRYDTGTVTPTSSPSMDIQVSSNFERLLFDACGRDGTHIRRLMQGLAQSGGFGIEAAALERMKLLFESQRVDEDGCAARIAGCLRETGLLLDPHSAIGLEAANRMGRTDTAVICLATAHPAKFPDAVERASGRRPSLPERIADIGQRPERVTRLPNDIDAVKTFIDAHARLGEHV